MENTVLKVEEVRGYSITEDWQADKEISEIKEIQAEISKLELVATNRIKYINDTLASQKAKLEQEIEFKKSCLRSFFESVDVKETKTMKKYILLSGDLIIKKPKKSIKLTDESKLLLSLKNANRAEMIKVTEKPKWAEIKKELEIDDDCIINKLTGEILGHMEGISIEESKEVFEIS